MPLYTNRERTADAYGNAARDLAPAFEGSRESCFFVYFDLQIGFLNASARRDIEANGGDPATYIGARLWDILGYEEDFPARIAVEWAIRHDKPVSLSIRAAATDYVWVENDVIPLSTGILIWYRETGPIAPPRISAGEADPNVLRGSHKTDAVQRLAGGIAHDINNLVTAIKGSAAELQEKDLSALRVVEYAREIEQAADKAASVTAQLLAFSRRQMLRPQVFDLGAHLRTLEQTLKFALDGIGKLHMEIDPQLGNVHADVAQIERALLNLVVNSRDAVRGRPAGVVTIRARNVELIDEFSVWGVSGAPGPYVRVDVEDNGPGIEESMREHLFEPFFTTKHPGGGLGLATTLGIVKQSNGYIWMQPADKGGTLFSVYLPRAVAATIAVRTVEKTETYSGGNERILLVEDEDAIRRVAKRSLELAGYHITEASDGASALKLAEQDDFDLLLTDVMMPKMLGTTLVEHLKYSRPKLPVLLMSGHSDDLVKQGLIDASTPFLAKPFTPPQLAEKVREILARHRAKARVK